MWQAWCFCVEHRDVVHAQSQAACDDLRLDKVRSSLAILQLLNLYCLQELREAEAEESAAMIANGLDHSANNMMLQQIQVVGI